MIKLNRPQLDPQEVFATCISRVRDQNLKQRMTAVIENVASASQEFDDLASVNALHTFVKEELDDWGVTADEMIAVYSQRMAKKGAPGRDAYDWLINSAPQGKCPLCGHRGVSTLDHHLPKAHYPSLAVVPLNLVPACSDCNKLKLANLPANESEEPLHPYFDDIEADKWLYASVVEGAPAALRFYIDAPEHWDDVLVSRVSLHVKTLGLLSLYALEGADELTNIYHQLRSIHASGGAELVRVEMEARAESCRQVRLNGWRAVAYEAFAQSHWFCEGGFNYVV